MENLSVPDDVRAFIGKYIGSVQQLEVLLCICKEQQREWTAEEISRKLRINTTSVSNRMLNLWTKRLLDVKEEPVRTFRYRPQEKKRDETIRKLAEIYEKNQMAILELIYSKTENDLRSFSDAFRLKKDEENG